MTDRHFQAWATSNANVSKDPALVAAFKLGTVNTHDMDVLVDRYKTKYPSSHLQHVPRDFGVRSAQEVFPGIKIERSLPNLNPALSNLTTYFGSNGRLLPFAKLTPVEKQVAVDIRNLVQGRPVDPKRMPAITHAVGEIAAYCKADSPLVSFQINRLHKAQQALLLEKGENITATQKGKPLPHSPAEMKNLEDRISHIASRIPKGAFSERALAVTTKQEVQPEQRIGVAGARAQLNDQFRITVVSKLFGTYSAAPEKLREALMKLPPGTAADKVMGLVHANMKNVPRDVTDLTHRYHTASGYLEHTVKNGTVGESNVAAANVLLNHDLADIVSFNHGREKDGSMIKRAGAIANDPNAIGKAAEVFARRSGAGRESFSKVAPLIGASALALGLSQPEALPFICTSPIVTSTATRAYVEDKSLIAAASTEWKTNQFFGSPSSVIGEHLKGSKSDQWKLLLLDTVALGAADFPRGALGIAGGVVKFSARQTEILGAAAAKRGIKLSSEDMHELAAGLAKTVTDSGFYSKSVKAISKYKGISEDLTERLIRKGQRHLDNFDHASAQVNAHIRNQLGGGPQFALEGPNIPLRRTPATKRDSVSYSKGAERQLTEQEIATAREIKEKSTSFILKPMLNGSKPEIKETSLNSLNALQLDRLAGIMHELRNPLHVSPRALEETLKSRFGEVVISNRTSWKIVGSDDKYHLTVSGGLRLCFKLNQSNGNMIVSDVRLLDHAGMERWAKIKN